MRKIIEWVKTNPIRSMFLVPILLVAGISISHVVSWYNITNPLSWAIYLSIAIEVGAMTALIAATNRIKGGVWFMFGLVTIIQMIGNIFFSYKEIDSNGDLFKSWVELTGPIWEMIGSDPTDIPAMKRWLAFLEGGLLPIISLTSLHFFVKYDGKKEDDDETPQVPPNNPPSTDQVTTKYRLSNDEVIDEKNVEKLTDLQKEVNRVWEKVNQLKEEGKFFEPTEDEILEEPTALANSGYRERSEMEQYEEDDETFISDGLEEVIEIVEEIPSDQIEGDENTLDNTNGGDLNAQPKTIIYKGRDRNAGFTRIDRF
jgi:hypothetical protein